VGALLVDMDGTVVDSSAAVGQVWTDYAAAHGLDPAEVLSFAHGRRPIETIARFDPDDPDPGATASRLQAQEMSQTEGITAVPGAADLWRSLFGGGTEGPDPEGGDAGPDRPKDRGDPVGTHGMGGCVDEPVSAASQGNETVPGHDGDAGPASAQARGLRAKVALVTSASRPLAEVRMAAAGLAMPALAVCAEDTVAGKPAPEGYLAAARALGRPIADCLVLEDSPAGAAAALTSGAKLIVVGKHAGQPDNPNQLAALADLTQVSARSLPDGRIELSY
jgi:beta-phosphoglucomutase-like phosphatase (HAD superfamily)